MKHIIFILIITTMTTTLFCTQSEIDSLETLLQNSKLKNRAEILNDLAAETINSNPAKSLELTKKALNLADKNSIEIPRALTFMATSYKDLNEYDKAYDTFQKALEAAERINYKEILPSIYNGIGTIYRKKSNIEKALEYYKKALEISREQKEGAQIALKLLNIGLIYYYESDYKTAHEYYLEAMKSAEEHDNEIFTAHALKEIGTIYKQWEKYDEAKQNLLKALEIYQKNDNKKREAVILNELGIIYKKENNYEKAIEFQERSLQIKEKLNYKYGIAASLNGLGISYKKLGKFPEALEYFRRALEYQNEIKDDVGAAASVSNIGAVYLKQGKYNEALKYFEESNIIAAKTEYIDVMINNYHFISEMYEKTGDYKKALMFFSKSVSLKDSVFNVEKHKQFANMQTKYETEKKERQNQLLKAENDLKKVEIAKQKTQRNLLIIVVFVILISLLMMSKLYKQKAKTNKIINVQKAELEKLNKTRERFFSIISHDLKNSFTSLQMGTELLSDISDLDEDEIVLIASELNKNVDNNFKLMENLLEWARIQIGRTRHEPESFDISEVIADITELLKVKAEEKKVNIISKIKENTLIFADKNMIFSVIKNLLTNAVKFSNEFGEIVIAAKNIDKEIEITVSDNGTGISKSNRSKLFKVDEIITTPGTNGEPGTGLGLILCKEFVEKNGGKISLESEVGKGTMVAVVLPEG